MKKVILPKRQNRGAVSVPFPGSSFKRIDKTMCYFTILVVVVEPSV